MTEHEQLRELIPIYALGALTPDEARGVEAHLDSCPECFDELSVHLTTAAALDGRQEPPSAIWERVSLQIAEPRELQVVDLAERRSRKFTTGLLSVAAAIALVFAGAVFSRVVEDDGIGEDDVVAAASEAAGRPGSVVTDFLVDDKSVARLVLTTEGQGFVIPTDELESLGDARTYQLWVINAEEAVISAGVLGSSPGPSVFTWSGEVTGLALTREVAGGVVSSEGDVVSVTTDF